MVRYFLLPLLACASAWAGDEAVRVGDPANPAALEEEIAGAIRTGAQSVVIAPGIYNLPHALAVKGASDLEISAYGVELAAESTETGALVIEDCRNVTFAGAVLRYTRPQTGQARILAVGEDDEGEYCDLQLEPGFPADATFSVSALVDGRTLLPKADGGAARALRPLDEPGKVRLSWNGQPGWKKIRDASVWAVPGDYLICRGRGAMMVHARGARECTFRDLTLYWGGVFGFYETHGCRANRYVRCTITYGPIPPGATMRALASQSADGLHSGGSEIGPQMENCSFEGQMDDGVNIHGHFYQVAHAEGTRLTLGFPAHYLEVPQEYQPGDRIGLFHLRSGQVSEQRIVAVEPSTFQTAKISRHEHFRGSGPAHEMRYVTLVLDGEVDVPFDSVAWFPGRCGAGYHISGCAIRNSWSRGFLLKAGGGVLADNLIEGCLGAGIVISTEMNWGESGYSRNITVRGNTIRRCAWYCVSALGAQAGALVVTTVGMKGMGHENIRITGNTFEGNDLTNIVIRWARGTEISGNRFVRPLSRESLTGEVGRSYGIDPRAVVWVGDSEDVSLSGNVVVEPGPFAEQGLSLSPSASAVRGVLDLGEKPAK